MFTRLINIILKPFKANIVNNERGNSIGQVITGVVGAVVGAIIGGPAGAIKGAMYGFTIGLTVGGILFPAEMQTQKVKPGTLNIQTSQYGIPVPVVYGSRKIAGNLIDYCNFQSHENEEETGGKGGGGQSYTTFTYSVTVAFGLCMSPSDRRMTVIKAWAGKDEISLDLLTIYDGSQTAPDSYLANYDDRPKTWKNLCYVVLRDYNLGNSTQIPNFTFELGIETSLTTTFQRDSALTLNAGEGLMRVLLIDEQNGFMYAASQADSTIIKINISDFTVVDIINIPDWLTPDRGVIDTVNGYAYFVLLEAPAQIIKIRLSDFTIVDTLEITAAYLTTAVIDVDNGFAYFGDEHTPAHIWKIDLSNFTLDSTLELNTGENNTQASCIDTVNGFAYFGTKGGSLNSIVKIQLSDFTRVDALTMHITGQWRRAISSVIDTTNGFAYFGFEYGGGANIVKINLSDFTYEDDLDLDSLSSYWYSAAIDVENGFGYFAGWANPTVVAQIKLSDLSLEAYITLNAGEKETWGAAAIDLSNNFLYIGTGSSSVIPGIITKIQLPSTSTSTGTFDMAPPDITEDILTNDLYGLGLSSSKLDSGVFAATKSYCETNSLLISPIFDSQISVLDALQHIISHHNGYIAYYDGLISHNQLKEETPISALTDADTVKKDGEFPIQISRKGGRSFNNKITVEWTKRNREYITGTVQDSSDFDIDTYGLKDATVKLDGITTFNLASKMCHLLLKKSLVNAELYGFELGPKSIGIKPGEVHTLTDSNVELSVKPIRIETISETPDKHIDVSAIEEVEGIHDLIVIGSDTSAASEPPALRTEPDASFDVVNPLITEVPDIYNNETQRQIVATYSKPADLEAWVGASLYMSTNPIAGFVKKSSSTGSGLTGTVDDLGFDGVLSLAYIDVVLDWGATLSSAASMDELVANPYKNLMFARVDDVDTFMQYQTVELIGTNTWRLSGLIYDLVNTPTINDYGTVVIGSKIGFYYNIPHTVLLEPFYEGSSLLYFKIVSFNHAGVEQSLADVSVIQVELLP
jgi:hypothetical protein